MTRAIWASVSGLDNHQTWMDVLGNNIANVNTVGYKDNRYEFEDILSQSVRGASPAVQGGVGGTNPEQVGLGTSTGSIDAVTTQGSLQPTNVPTDVAIAGSGYFVLSDGNNTHFTRDSVFQVDGSGNIVNASTGLHLRGILADTNGNLQFANGLQNLTVPQTVNSANQTSGFDAFGNLDSRSTTPVQQQIQVFDSLGQQHTVVLTFTPTTAGSGSWNVTATSPDLSGNPTLTPTTGANITFGSNGQLTGANQIVLNTGGSNWLIPNTVTAAGTGTTSNAATGQAITINLNNTAAGVLTSFAAPSSITSQANTTSNVGNAAAFLKTFSIGQDGKITGSYSNGTNKLLGQIELATFTNPAGLQRIGQNDFDVSSNSGQANITNPGAGAAGQTVQGSVETSNVDLANELAEVILAERGFQANSRMITTSDEMLQDVVSMKR
ncbi:MAG TPA: flagellar hook protein FlgE [Chloroflexota bacterium]|nr:flagellar hook protein FlgE [Chloroflexota bacterium]